jgi:hypothetical protein
MNFAESPSRIIYDYLMVSQTYTNSTFQALFLTLWHGGLFILHLELFLEAVMPLLECEHCPSAEISAVLEMPECCSCGSSLRLPHMQTTTAMHSPRSMQQAMPTRAGTAMLMSEDGSGSILWGDPRLFGSSMVDLERAFEDSALGGVANCDAASLSCKEERVKVSENKGSKVLKAWHHCAMVPVIHTFMSIMLQRAKEIIFQLCSSESQYVHKWNRFGCHFTDDSSCASAVKTET